ATMIITGLPVIHSPNRSRSAMAVKPSIRIFSNEPNYCDILKLCVLFGSLILDEPPHFGHEAGVPWSGWRGYRLAYGPPRPGSPNRHRCRPISGWRYRSEPGWL